MGGHYVFGVGVVLSDLQLTQVERAMLSCFKVSIECMTFIFDLQGVVIMFEAFL